MPWILRDIFAVTLLAILASRAIAVPLSPAFPIPELEYVINHSEASLLVSSPKFAAKAQQVLAADLASKPVLVELPKHAGGAAAEDVPLEAEANPGQAGLMLYTSGTTNKPVRRLTAHQYVAHAKMHPRKASCCPSPS